MRHAISRVTLFTLFAVRLAAQQSSAPQPPADRLQRAAALFAQSDWKGALDAYGALAAAYPSHALSRFRLGVSLMEVGRLTEAEASLRQGEALGIPAAQAAFRLAEVLAEQGRSSAAMRELERATMNQLLIAPSALESDRHLASLKSNPDWKKVLDAADANIRPCMHDSRFREFDFWIGDWDVRPTGQPAVGPPARNTVTAEDNGCVVMEHWTAPSGSEGQSFNIFDRSYGLWRQTWVDNSGGQHDYRGSLKDGNMVFTGDTPAANGRLGRVPTRLTFFHISRDSVRQFSEVSADSGRTWQTSYDLMYVRRRSSGSLGGTSATNGMALTEDDRAAIRQLDSAFVRGWLRDDTTAVLGLFAPDAVLLPPGAAPVSGLTAIRAYWWPTDGSHTRIRSFERHIAEVDGNRDLAFVRTTGALDWVSSKAGTTAHNVTRSTDLLLVSRDVTGRWHIVRQMWSALPPR